KIGHYLLGPTGESAGKVLGGIAGGGAGAAGLNVSREGLLEAFLSPKSASTDEAAVVPLSQSPNADAYNAVRTAQRAALRREVLPAPCSASQEAGWPPRTTLVPIRTQPPADINYPQVPGPDTSGRGNILTPLARKGDAEAAAELQRRGRSVLFVPDESSYLD